MAEPEANEQPKAEREIEVEILEPATANGNNYHQGARITVSASVAKELIATGSAREKAED